MATNKSKANEVKSRKPKTTTSKTETVTAEIVTRMAEGELQGTQEENAKLEVLEKKFISGIQTVCEMGAALDEIRDQKLYKARGYKTFEAYVKKFFEISRTYAYRLINQNRVRGLIGVDADVKLTESFLRPLASIHEDSAIECIWNEAKGESEGLPDAKTLAEKVAEYKLKQRAERHKSDDVSLNTLLEKSKKRTDRIIKLYPAYSARHDFSKTEKEKLLSEARKQQAEELKRLKTALGLE